MGQIGTIALPTYIQLFAFVISFIWNVLSAYPSASLTLNIPPPQLGSSVKPGCLEPLASAQSHARAKAPMGSGCSEVTLRWVPQGMSTPTLKSGNSRTL